MIAATIGNTIGSLIAYAIGAYGGRPFLERYGKYLLIRPHEIELAERVLRASTAPRPSFFSRLLPIVRTFISFPAGVARMPLGQFIVFSTAGAFLWSMPAGLRRARCSARTGSTSATRSSRSTSLIAVVVVVAVVLFVWWRLGTPGRPTPTFVG